MQKFYATSDIILATHPQVHRVISLTGSTLLFHLPGTGTQMEYTSKSYDGARLLFRAFCAILQAEELPACADVQTGEEQTQSTEAAPERWQPTRAEPFWYIGEMGDIVDGLYTPSYPANRLRAAFGNCFPTKAAALSFRDSALAD